MSDATMTDAAPTIVEEQKENPVAAPTAASSSSASSSSTTADVPPNQTLYINNINEKVKLPELKKTLYLIFGTYGNILEVNCASSYRMRGQAWVVFDSLNAATRAQRELQNFLFFGKPLRITFAKAKSDTVAKLDGSFVQRPKRKAVEDPTKPKKGGVLKKQKTDKKKAAEAGTGAVAASASAVPAAAPVLAEVAPPHRILFVEHLPEEATSIMVEMLFRQYPGFKEARVIPGKKVAFVEFDEIFQAATAMEALQGFKITGTHLMKITFAKK